MKAASCCLNDCQTVMGFKMVALTLGCYYILRRIFMKLLISLLLAFGITLKLAVPAPGQTVASAALQQYNESFVAHPQLVNGPEYVDYSRAFYARIGHQWLVGPELQGGGVHYNGQYFGGVRLNYDVVRDQVVLLHPTSSLKFRLVNENLRFFLFQNRRFVRLQADSTDADVIRTGFYEVLADGPVQVLARRSKRQQQLIQAGHLNVSFTPTDKLFLQKAGKYYPVKSKGAALRYFEDHKAEVQSFVRDNKLSFRKNQLEADLVRVARFYAQLPASGS